ncbi:MAG: glucosamine-6-phosphate deaminase [Lachnospiraceae bacterium]|nr:glucosamine-6-phosphate deaminase [Lachnospiraceae bacterium]
MKLICCKDYEDMSKHVAQDILAEVKANPEIVLGLATGSTPEGCYKYMVEAYEAGEADFSKVSSVNLDEYVGLGPDDDQGYRYFMNKHLFDHVNIDKANTYVPNGLAKTSEEACAEHEANIEKLGGIDVQLLGLGGNGHIGFNEPGESFVKGTHIVDLTPGTIEANARFFESIDDVPKQAYSMGVGNILDAQKVILAVSGTRKAQALYEVIYGSICPKVQGSILQLHKNVVIYADEEALSVIREKGLL